MKKHDTILEKYGNHVIYEKVKMHNLMKKVEASHKYPILDKSKEDASRNRNLVNFIRHGSIGSSDNSKWYSIEEPKTLDKI